MELQFASKEEAKRSSSLLHVFSKGFHQIILEFDDAMPERMQKEIKPNTELQSNNNQRHWMCDIKKIENGI